MAFISFEFAVFFLAVALVYFVLPLRLRWVWLLGASLFFYGWAQPIYLIQLLAATFATFYLAQRIEEAPTKQAKQGYLAVGVMALVANLLVFKYTAFFNETFRDLFGVVGLSYSVPEIHILLPLGISFYTFLLVGYLIDVLRGAKAERNVGVFALYTSFFPKLVAGPIERTKNLLPQLHQEQAFDYARVAAGLQLMAWGVFKKVMIADRIAPFVNDIYADPQAYSGFMLSFATWLYAFQLYADFSGYTDIALGAALVLGYKLAPNFNRPYFATSIQDFWKRWHISLTSWLTDYVYTPLTRQKWLKLKFFTMMLVGLFATFVISGLWHGAQWTYVLWGALHGAYIVAALMLQKPFNNFVRSIGLDKRPKLYRGLKIAFTFVLVCLAYVLFRASSLEDAGYIYANLFTGWAPQTALYGIRDLIDYRPAEFVLAMLGIVILMGADLLKDRVDVGQSITNGPVWARWGVYYVGVASILLLGAMYDANQQFIYFQF